MSGNRPYSGLLTVILLMALLLIPALAGHAQETVTISTVSVDRQGQTVNPGESVTVSVNWTSSGDTVGTVQLRVYDTVVDSRDIVFIQPSGSAQILFTLSTTAMAGPYAVTIQPVGHASFAVDNAFTVPFIPVQEASITSPTTAGPATVGPGRSLTVQYSHRVNLQTQCYLRLVQAGGNVVASVPVTLPVSTGATGSVTLAIPESVALGTYDLVLVNRDNNTHLATRTGAVLVAHTASAAITSPTRTNPVSVAPGAGVIVRYNYDVTGNSEIAVVRLTNAGGTVLASKEETLGKTGGSGAVRDTTLTVPAGTAPGKYNLTVVQKSNNAVMHSQTEAVIVEHRVTATINSPTRNSPASLSGGERLTVSFDYTSPDNQSTVNVVVQKGDAALVSASVVLDKTTSSKNKSVNLTIPSDAASGKYDLVIKSSLGGATIRQEREAVVIETKISCTITAPTKTSPVTVRAGSTLSVKFDYTANADSNIELRVLKSDGSVIASTIASLERSTTKRSQNVSLSIPSGTAAGRYDLTVNTRYTDQVLNSQTQAVVVEDPVRVTLQSPTTANPVHFNTTGRVDVAFSYTAETSATIEVRILKSDGKTLVSNSVNVARTTTSKSEKVTVSLPAYTPPGIYDLELVNKTTANRLLLESRAVSVVSYPLNVQVKLVIGQSNRWVNGQHQTIDVAPMIVQGRTLMPIRHVGEALGWSLLWDETKKMASVSKGEYQVRVWLNSSQAQVSRDNGHTWRTAQIDPENSSVQPVLISGRVLLPLRFVAESLNTKVDWDTASRTITVTQN